MGRTLFRLPKSFKKQAAPRFSTSAQSRSALSLRQTALVYTEERQARQSDFLQRIYLL